MEFMSSNTTANMAGNSVDTLSKHGFVVGVVGLLIVMGSDIGYGYALNNDSFDDEILWKIGTGLVLFFLTILEIMGWYKYLKYKKDDVNYAQKQLFNYNLPIIIIIIIFVLLISVFLTDTNNHSLRNSILN